jgi:hypothetical protein
MKIKKTIEKNFNLILILGLVAGLFMPGLEKAPEYIVIVLLSTIIFFHVQKYP